MADDHVMQTLIAEDKIRGETEEETVQLRALGAKARSYILGQSWCRRVESVYFGIGVGHIFGVFLVTIEPSKSDVDRKLWVVVGDLPSAYLVMDNAPTPADAAEGYCELMDDWIAAVRSGSGIEDVFPVDAAATTTNADALQGRIEMLRSDILPSLTQSDSAE